MLDVRLGDPKHFFATQKFASGEMLAEKLALAVNRVLLLGCSYAEHPDDGAGGSREVILLLGRDWADHSFGWSLHQAEPDRTPGRLLMNGGIVWDGHARSWGVHT